MTTYSPAEHYDYCTNITATIYGVRDKSVVLFHDFECQVQIETELNLQLNLHCTDVLVDGVSLHHGDDLAKAIRLFVMAKADEELDRGGWLFDQVTEREGLSLSGHPGNPDTCWERV